MEQETDLDMSKYIDADKLKAEIERKRDGALERQKNLEKIGQETVLNIMIAEELNMLISFIDSLQQEMELPEKYQTPDWLFEGKEQPVEGLEEAAERYNEMMSWAWEAPNYPHKAAFIAGAEWMKAKMLEDAEECMVMDFSSNLPRPQVDILLDPGKYHTGDKVKVIVIKED